MIVTSKEAKALVDWLIQEKTLKGFGWMVGWADRGEGEKDGVARKGEEKRERSFFFYYKSPTSHSLFYYCVSNLRVHFYPRF
jgi:hypothetical protein